MIAEGGGEAAVWRVGAKLHGALREACSSGSETAHRAALWRCAALLVHARNTSTSSTPTARILSSGSSPTARTTSTGSSPTTRTTSSGSSPTARSNSTGSSPTARMLLHSIGKVFFYDEPLRNRHLITLLRLLGNQETLHIELYGKLILHICN